ncbi:maleylacetoacetate isomerase [Sandaracinobacteroides sp. A072]|uniref:maleylacetoacetate isomerase n=1 Tax=Sandaracinobacteroides sp. A072 TaxID=3461146 RepID=UPI004042B142
MNGPLRLHGYFRSGAAWRVRIGLNWKGLSYESLSIDLRTGAQGDAAWRARNPQAMVPALELPDGTLLTQSLAILEWLEETVPEPAFLPADPLLRARIRAMALVIAADTHPVQNLGVLKRVEALAGADAARDWARQTIVQGLSACEALAAREAGPFAFGAEPTLADILIVPQLFNARRFGVALSAFPRILEIEAACAPIPAFARARPEVQPDAD